MNLDKVILFGAGKYFLHKLSLMDKYEIVAILDNRIESNEEVKWENTEISLLNPRMMNSTGKEKIFLMAMNFFSMWEQLVSLGVDPGRLVHPFFEKPYFQSDEVVHLFVEKLEFQKSVVQIKEKDGSMKSVRSMTEWEDYIRELYRRVFPIINSISKMSYQPVSLQFATERGTPVDRFYIDEFLKSHSKFIQGDVLEIEDATYTKRYGKGLHHSIVTDVSSTAQDVDFNSNLETGEGIRENIADCFILTQTLMYIFDLKTAVENIYRTLKPNGVALITCSGLSQNSRRCMDNYGAFFNFNAAALKKMFSNDKMTVLETGSYGNVKTVVAHLTGLCQEDLQTDDFLPSDPYYPLIVYAVVRKDG